LTEKVLVFALFLADSGIFPGKKYNPREGFCPPGERKIDRRHTNLPLPGEVCVTAGAVQECDSGGGSRKELTIPVFRATLCLGIFIHHL